MSNHSSLNNTIVENSPMETDGDCAASSVITQEHIGALLASINLLNDKVNELRRDNEQIRSAIRMGDSNSAAASTSAEPVQGNGIARAATEKTAEQSNKLLMKNKLHLQSTYTNSGIVNMNIPSPGTQRPQYLPQSSNVSHNGVISYVDNIVAKLYPLPYFDGNSEDWPLFSACYHDTTREFGYNNRQNLMRLQRALQGH
ncbi:uncharacterized protein [Eurosta solidaginis]|uniref:uncharacterized protein n=1 Tax=Eurosta solidaginis TaxID=178769 RepID=UPI0035316473